MKRPVFRPPIKVLLGAVLLGLLAVAGILFANTSKVAAQSPPAIPHDVAGREQCLLCHGSQSAKPFPVNHAAFDEKTCLTCHSAAPMGGSSTTETPPQTQDCMNCHSNQYLSMNLTDEESLSLYVDGAAFASSVHGGKLMCTDCHTYSGASAAASEGTFAIPSEYPHPTRDVVSTREYSLALYEVCKSCHFDNYTKTLDSVHYQVLSRGDQTAPICTDCHGAHNMSAPTQPRSKISQTCAQCHETLYADYAESVHGSALVHDNNPDVPVCTDCHQSHMIEDPTTAAFRLQSVDTCSGCHSNKEMMQKYGISTNVVKTYLQDFHGATVALQSEGNKDIWVSEAVCTDCHGVHNIVAVDSPNSPVIKENLTATCRNCHPDATANFPSAWLSHYEPTVQKAPLVYFIRRFYWVLIPFIVVGLLAHILIDLWRTITNRR